ncbi:acyl-CoA dehydrogenase family protein [Nonomuraea candida]|uniref:acyl-CoA dehydrogenase family protein n=1 Tax=Nonomuraea candida TaxID=359159 RepID=UPI0005BC15D9|nr:acyl-CoA dehydrogenase family protein [Nonomuraea candida]
MALADELRAVVRDHLAARPGASWQAFARDVGVAGLLVPEEHGGAGCGPAEMAAVAEELGRVLSPHPFLQTAVMAVEALRACLPAAETPATDGRPAPEHGAGGSHAADGPDGLDRAGAAGGPDGAGEAGEAGRLLARLAEGAVSATVVLPGDGELRLDGDLLTGIVPYATAGELVLLYVDGLLVEAVPAGREAYTTMDESRPLQRLVFHDTPVRRIGDGSSWVRVRDLGIAALAAEQAGGARRCLEMAVEHAKRRHQFGRPIGSFQAIKHKLADLLLLVESATSAARAAAEDGVAAAVAGSYCTEAYLTAARENIQIHGGIGITWEHPAHRYLKRATSDAQLFCPPQAHRARLGAHIFASG